MRAPALSIMIVGVAAVAAVAQTPQRPAPASGEADESAIADVQIESYLDRLGLSDLLAQQLEQRLNSAPRDRRVVIAERLGKVYVRMLTAAKSVEQARPWEQRARELLTKVPEADTFELRVNLNRAIYVSGEELAERFRLRLASREEAGQAETSLLAVAQQCREIGSRLSARVQNLERLEATLESTEALKSELAEARRLRSLAYYYAGWASTYVAMLSGATPPAVEAMKDFAWLVGTGGGRLPSVDKLPQGYLQYEHIARAAVGCAMCASMRGNDVEAIRWLDAVAENADTPESVRAQLTSRRLVVYAQARRWADVERIVRMARRPELKSGEAPSTKPVPLSPVLARLLAVLTLGAERTTSATPLLETLARIGLGDLVAQREAAQVLDLVRLFGTAPLGDTGFIVHYVRGLQAYDQARAAHHVVVGGAGDASDEPASDPATANLYRAAAELLETALRQDDAESFIGERVRAAVHLGRALFYSGDLRGAGDRFVQAYEIAGKGEHAEEALWLAVLSFERLSATAGEKDPATQRRNQLIALYLQNYPESDKAARLVLLQASAGGMSDDDALKVLAGVAKDAPMYEASRRQMARILHAKVRSASPGEREFAIERFMGVGEEVLAMDLRVATSPSSSTQQSGEAGRRAASRIRVMLDAMLSGATPDVARAEALLRTYAQLAAQFSIEQEPVAPELRFRELQVALLRNNLNTALTLADEIAAMPGHGSQFGVAADRLLYRRLAQEWSATSNAERTLERARALASVGVRVIDRMGSDAEALAAASVLSAHVSVAQAAAFVFAQAGEGAMRDLALRLDLAVLVVQPKLGECLYRVGDLSESAGDLARARQAWTTLADSAQTESDLWFESRYRLMRVLSTVDAKAFSEFVDLHRALYPSFGPSPWGEKMRRLAESSGGSVQPGGAGGERP